MYNRKPTQIENGSLTSVPELVIDIACEGLCYHLLHQDLNPLSALLFHLPSDNVRPCQMLRTTISMKVGDAKEYQKLFTGLDEHVPKLISG
ncbi:hypothetical protein RJT34_16660 [Clitoria ternatea]|uniref:Uncharacterized protein n=1 Tax=Clitoria ternatea TaxID=43366 RepID=A0AAN9J8U3_CLITE